MTTISNLYYHIHCSGKTLKELQGLTGVHHTKLSRYQLSREPIPMSHLLKLSEYFKVNPQDLLGERVVEEV